MDFYFKKSKTLDFMNVAQFMESLIYAIKRVDAELSARNEYYDDMAAEYHAEMMAEYRSAMADARI